MLDGLKIIDAEVTLEPPDDLDDEFACTVAVTFEVNEKLLAQLLDVQQRVLEKAIEQTKPSGWFFQLQSCRVGRLIKSNLNNTITATATDMTNEIFGRASTVTAYDYTDNTEYWATHITGSTSVEFTIEFDVLGKWT